MKKINVIVALTKEHGIGYQNKIPFYLPSDIKYFKDVTIGDKNKTNAVIMGKRTYYSISKKYRPLKDRLNIVISSEIVDGVLNFTNFEDCISYLQYTDVNEIFVAGGARLYEEAMSHPKLDKVYITRILDNYECDVFFPKFNMGNFKVIEQSEEKIENGIRYYRVILKSKN
jgi:dihydrofolate reductase